MKRFIFILLSFFLFAQNLHAQQADVSTVTPGAADGAGDVADDTGTSNESFEPDYFTGAATYRITIDVPPGRAGLTPKIAFDYNSHDRDNDHGLGAGWEINESYIQRSLVRGTADYAGTDFILHEGGQNRQLLYGGTIQNNCVQYRFKVEDQNLRYFYKCADHWEVVDKSGKTAVYGGPNATQSADTDEHKFRWYLTSIKDLSGNEIEYVYNSRCYSELSFFYLDHINYTKHQNGPAAAFTVQFNYDDVRRVYPDYRAGFSSKRPPHLENIIIRQSNGTTIKRYDFLYDEDNGVSLLQSVQLTAGEMPNIIALPAKIFHYATLRGLRLWQRQIAAWNDPSDGVFGNSNYYSMRDMNGDALPDRVYVGPDAPTINVNYNTGSGFAATTAWQDACDGGCQDNPQQPFHQYLMDMNGDGLADRVLGGRMTVDGQEYHGFYVRYNDGSQLQWASPWNDPLCADVNSPKCGVLQVMDFNSDGLPDRYDRDENSGDFLIYFNNGRGFNEAPVRWQDPLPNQQEPALSSYGLMDFNGDGLVDRISVLVENPSSVFVYYNKGDGWFANRMQWDYPQAAVDFPKTFMDMNGDGLPDLVAADRAGGQYLIYFNSGSSFTEFAPIVARDPVQDNNFRAQLSYERNGVVEPAFRDMNGDGFLDRVVPTADGQYEVWLTDFSTQNGSQPLHVLTSIDDGKGVVTDLFYTASNTLQNRFLPFNQFVLSKIVLREGAEQKTTDIKYYGGQFATNWSNVFGRRINGYQFVQITDPLGNVEQRWYHQANDVMGRNHLFVVDEMLNADGTVNMLPWPAGNEGVQWNGVRIWDDMALSGRMFQRVQYIKKPGIQGWVRSRKEKFDWNISYRLPENQSSRAFVWMGGKSSTDYEGFADGRSKSTAYEYDHDSGNLIQQTERGEAGGNDPERISRFENFAEFNTPFGLVVSLQANTMIRREGNNGRNDTRFITNAQLRITRHDELLQNNGLQNHLITSYAYDAFGNVTQKTDPRGTVINIAYDAASQTYPITFTVANRFITRIGYDLRFGKVSQKVTPDRRVEERSYDVLGRLQEVDFENRWLERYEYIDRQPRGDGARFLSVVKKFTHIDSDPQSNNQPRQVSFKDGQGRVVQTSARSERANTWRIQQTRYVQDATHNEVYTSEPRFAALLDFVANPGALVEVKTTLDSSGRITEMLPPVGDATSPTGATRFAYGFNNDPWVKTTTDAEGKIKREYSNVWGKIIQVSEFNNNREIITRHAYDFWNNLTRITDPSGNRTEFVYDNLGRKVLVNEPNTGAKTFVYDAVGNLTAQSDANNNRLGWDYDALNRVTESRSFAVNAQRDTVRYKYDEAIDFAGANNSADYGIRTGELFMVQDAAGWTKFGYDQYGHANKTARYITTFNQTLSTSTTNDPDGRVLSVIYPKGNVGVRYAYDPAGQVKELRETARNELLYSINPNADYDQFGHLLRENFGDGTRDEHFYYARSHRLQQNITKVVATNQRYNNKTYSYNRVKNVTYIHDALNPEGQNADLQNIEYDDLHRIVGYETGNNWESQARVNYDYDERGNIIRNSESFRNDDYTYNNANRLTALGAEQIGYDNNGNITAGRSRGYAYNARNQLSQVTMQNGWQISYEYDYAGQRVGKIVQKGNEQSKTYFLGGMFEVRDGQLVHNIFAGNKLVATIARGQVGGPNGPALAGAGVAWSSARGGSAFGGNQHPLAPLGIAVTLVMLGFVLSLRLSAGLLEEGAKRRGNPVFAPALSPVVILNSLVVILSETKNLLLETILDPHRRFYRLATLSFTLLIFLPITTHAAVFRPDVDDNWPARSSDYFFYVHSDYLGSSNLLTEGEAKTTHGGYRFVKGELVQRVEYTPFGKERFVLNASLEELPKYTGQTDDIETDLYYYGSRYYDPVLGRFIQPDSIIADVYSSQSLNLYSYVLNNPLRYVDPAGYAPEEIGHPNLNDDAQIDPNDSGAPRPLSEAYDNDLTAREREGIRGSRLDVESGTTVSNDYAVSVKTDFLAGTNFEGLRSEIAAERSSGYLDFNISVGAGVGITGGFIVAPNGNVYFYAGGGVVSSPGVAITISPNSISPGLNAGVSGAYGVAGQLGVDSKNSVFFEVGAGSPGFGVTGYYIFADPIFNINDRVRLGAQAGSEYLYGR